MTRLLLMVLLCQSCSGLAVAQSCPNVQLGVKRNQSVTFWANHDGVGVTLYKLRINGAVVSTQPVGNLSNGVIVFPWKQGFSQRACYTATIAALDLNGFEHFSQPASVNVTASGRP